ncbi:MATE family efflux transporter [Chroococcidiopsis thermalis]|uniref:Probable multidrug resistance protein NorM n=1 Tax=Chroococcidiopsis thermalis (strain PCC 7203) TaxID=251229 RepID=K9TWW0_CHRTP|nr:MATE family efflux transporter [Chroococcidiopsis thermalis]AFY86868.1 MATE efflux family protein [Chroococcidiopsis thermalis PCC 7203]
MTSHSVRSNIWAEIQEFLKLAIPLVSAQLAQSVTGFADTVVMGRLGQETLAAGGLASITFMTLLNTATSIVVGVSPLIAAAHGAKNKSRVMQVTRQGLWISVVLAIALMPIVEHLDALMLQLGQTSRTASLANEYLDVALWGIFPALGFTVLRSLVAGVSQARPVMVIAIIWTLFDIAGNYLLGLGMFGFPRLGLVGLALTSALSFWGRFLSLAVYILWHKQLRTYGIFQALHQIKPRIIWELLWLGAPIGIATAIEYGLFNIVTFLMGMLGTEILAAHQIVLQTTVVFYMIPLGMSYATTVRVGQWLGQQNLKAAKRAGYVSMVLGASSMTLMAIAVLIFPQQIIGLFIDLRDPANANVLSIAAPMLFVAALGEIVDGVQRTANGVLQGLQDTRVPMLLGFLAYWGAGLTSGYLLGFPFGLGGVGLWIGQSIGLAIASIAFIWRFRKLSSRKQLQYSLYSCPPNS